MAAVNPPKEPASRVDPMATRAEMLERVRRALQKSESGPPPAAMPALELDGVMPFVAPEDYLPKFESEWEKVGGVSYQVTTADELEAVFEKILVLAETQAIVLSRNPLLARLGIAQRLAKLDKFVTTWGTAPGSTGTDSLSDFSKASFEAGSGITGVDFVLAESGTLVLSSATEGVQVASLAPAIHIALYRRSQLVGSLDEVLAKLRLAASPNQAAGGRSVVFVTGTSRTADIEQILIRGVHGPREVHAILVEDSCLDTVWTADAEGGLTKAV